MTPMILLPPISSAMAFVLTVEKHIFFWMLAITFFFSIALVAVVSRDRRWYELVCLFIITYICAIFLSTFLFEGIVGIPFAKLDTVSVP